MKDRLPPCDQDAEMAVIGACLTDPVTCVPETGMVASEPEIFYDIRCRASWEAMLSMSPNEVNVISINSKATFPQSAVFLSDCQDKCVSSANLSVWLEIIQNKYTLRQIIKTAQKAVADAFESSDAVSSLDVFERAAMSIRPARRERKDIKALLSDAQELIEFRSQNWNAITGLTTGLLDLDKLSDGLHRGELIVLAALPSCGKTALGVNIAMHNALDGLPVGIVSAEMRPVQLVIRSICSESRVNFKRITSEDLPAMISVMGRMAKANIHIEQASGFTIGQVIATARRMKQSADIKLLVVDYIQRLTGVGENRQLQIASIGAGLKDIALELDIPVIGLSQLNDDGKLRESRALGQDGDSVWILANDGEWRADVQPVNLRIEKCRDGETGIVPLTFLKTITRFECQSHTQEENQ
jgi:replicative DNA helicase